SAGSSCAGGRRTWPSESPSMSASRLHARTKFTVRLMTAAAASTARNSTREVASVTSASISVPAMSAGIPIAARLTTSACGRYRWLSQATLSEKTTTANASAGPRYAAASMMQTKDAETSIAPCHCAAVSEPSAAQSARMIARPLPRSSCGCTADQPTAIATSAPAAARDQLGCPARAPTAMPGRYRPDGVAARAHGGELVSADLEVPARGGEGADDDEQHSIRTGLELRQHFRPPAVG